MNPDALKGVLLILFSALMFGSYGVWARLLGPDFPVLFQSWTKALILVIVLFPIVYLRKEIVSIPRSDWLWMSVFLIATSSVMAPIYYALNHLTIGTATLLFYSGMLITMYVIGFIFFKEDRTFVKYASLLLGLAGLASVYTFSFVNLAFLAVFLAIFNGIASGTEVSASKKLTGTYSTLYLSLLSWAIIAITNSTLSVAVSEPQIMPTLTLPWLYLLGFTLASFLGFWTIMEGLRHVDASVGGIIGLMEIIFAIIFGIVLFSEPLTYNVLIGGGLILCAAALPHIHDLFKTKK